MIYEDEVTCDGCGATVTHLLCGPVTEDADYRMCETCIEERDGQDEPEHDDSVKCCPDCERPNQFGELCAECEREREANHDALNCSACGTSL